MSDIVALQGVTDTPHEPGFGDYVQLLKPRVMSLVVFTALVGLLVAPVSLHPVEALSAVLFIALGAGASGALNMWWDADIDALMKRTARRPVPAGKIGAEEALALGLALSGISVVMLWLATNWAAAALLAFTIFFYVVVYSMWLKRLTPQNIVIGGAAGAFPPMIGWVAATGSVSVEALLMFALIFMWTPPHFWALALFMKEDYHTAGVPMLTVTHGRRATRAHILVYTLLLVQRANDVGSLGGAECLVRARCVADLAAGRGDGRGRHLRGGEGVLPLFVVVSFPAFRGLPDGSGAEIGRVRGLVK